jgi:hypothetical protein
VRKRIGASSLDVKLLQHLNGQGIVATLDEHHSLIALYGLCRIPADRVEQDVGIQKTNADLLTALVHVITRYAVPCP